MSSVALPSDGFGAHPITVESHWNINPQVLEDLAQWLEQRGLRTPIGNVVGYQRERYVAFVGKSGTQSINDSTETDLTFDTTTSDKQKTFDGTSTVTLPYNGLYLVSGYTEWAPTTAGSRYHTIVQNGVTRARDWRTAGALLRRRAPSARRSSE